MTIRAAVKPGGEHAIGFALLGDAADAALDATVVRTNADGVAETRLHAPSVASTFLIRATLLGDGDATDTVEVAVSSKGFATIEAVPHYNGVRHVTTWTATAISRTTCAALAPTLPDVPPGGLETTGTAKQTLVIHDAPVGPPIAVVVRAGHFAFGCIDSPPLVPNKATKLGVTIVDKPLDLAATQLDFGLQFVPDPADLAALTADGLQVVDEKIFNQSPDAGFLLDAMAALAPAGFSEARSANGWDSATAQHLDGLGVDFHALVDAWTSAGLAIQPPTLAIRVRGSDVLAGSLEARLTILSLGSFTPAEAGFTKTINHASWLAQTGDMVQLGATVPWRPSALIASSALVGARIEYPGVSDRGRRARPERRLHRSRRDARRLRGVRRGMPRDVLHGRARVGLDPRGDRVARAEQQRLGAGDHRHRTGPGRRRGSAELGRGSMARLAPHDLVTQANLMGAATATKTGSHQPP